jgi:hypothetical protein
MDIWIFLNLGLLGIMLIWTFMYNFCVNFYKSEDIESTEVSVNRWTEKGNNMYVSLSFSETYTCTYISIQTKAYHVIHKRM